MGWTELLDMTTRTAPVGWTELLNMTTRTAPVGWTELLDMTTRTAPVGWTELLDMTKTAPVGWTGILGLSRKHVRKLTAGRTPDSKPSPKTKLGAQLRQPTTSTPSHQKLLSNRQKELAWSVQHLHI